MFSGDLSFIFDNVLKSGVNVYVVFIMTSLDVSTCTDSDRSDMPTLTSLVIRTITSETTSILVI